MKFVADESVDQPIVEQLRSDGHQVLAIAELNPSVSDEYVLNQANTEDAILITADTDFGELVYRRRQLSSGVLLLRLAGLSPQQKANLVSNTIQTRQSELYKAFAVLNPGLLRIRKTFPK